MKVLLATDLSEAGLRSVEGLCACKASDFEHVTLLHVIDLDLYTAGGSVPGIAEWANVELEKVAADLRELGFEVDVRVEIGLAVDTIKSVADEIGADLIAVTNLGKGALTGRLLGSTAERLAPATGLPVLVERVEHRGEQWCRLGIGSPFQRIVLGVDLEGDAQALIGSVGRLPGIELLRVVHVAADEPSRAAAQQKLEEAVRAAQVGSAIEVVTNVGNAAEGLLADATQTDATAIAVATCQHGLLHRGVLGSVAREVALHSDRAVLLLPPA